MRNAFLLLICGYALAQFCPGTNNYNDMTSIGWVNDVASSSYSQIYDVLADVDGDGSIYYIEGKIDWKTNLSKLNLHVFHIKVNNHVSLFKIRKLVLLLSRSFKTCLAIYIY